MKSFSCRHLEVATLGVACLQSFIETNWVGFPSLNWSQSVDLFPPLKMFEGDQEKTKSEFLNSVRSELVRNDIVDVKIIAEFCYSFFNVKFFSGDILFCLWGCWLNRTNNKNTFKSAIKT
jgi:hypothetical protein